MKHRATIAIASLAMAAVVGGCAGSSPGATVTFQRYQFTCCAATDIEQTWHPGQTVQLHWMVKSAGQTSTSTPDPIALVAFLDGPYADAVSLKSGATAARNIPAELVFTNDRSPDAPISSFQLPADLPAGLYNLTYMVEAARGNSMRAASIVSVGP